MSENRIAPLLILIMAVAAMTLPSCVERAPGGASQVDEPGSPTINYKNGVSRGTPIPLSSGLYFTVLDETFIEADGPGGIDTYQIIRDQLCPGSNPNTPGCIEASDLYANNHPGVRHIIEKPGSPFGPYFTFIIHDTDKDKDYGDAYARQRNEIKGDASSPAKVLATEGESVRYHWHFRIPRDYPASNTIMFQLHSVALDNGEQVGPILKVESVGPDLVIRHDPDNCGDRNPGPGCDPANIASAPLSALRGQWLEAEVFATFTNNGYLHTTIRDQSGTVIMEAERMDIDMWTSSTENIPFTRPKWGIYRSFDNINSEDTIDFADIKIQEISPLSPGTVRESQ